MSLPTGTHSAGGVVPAGALSSYTSRLLSSKPFQDFRSFAKGLNRLMPSEIQVRLLACVSMRTRSSECGGVGEKCMCIIQLLRMDGEMTFSPSIIILSSTLSTFVQRTTTSPRTPLGHTHPSIQRTQDINAKIDEYARGLIQGGTLFEELVRVLRLLHTHTPACSPCSCPLELWPPLTHASTVLSSFFTDTPTTTGLLLHRPGGWARPRQPHPHPREPAGLALHQARAAPRQGMHVLCIRILIQRQVVMDRQHREIDRCRDTQIH